MGISISTGPFAAIAHTVLVIGGYGFFGKRICASLAGHRGIRLLIGGRDRTKAARPAVLGLRENMVLVGRARVHEQGVKQATSPAAQFLVRFTKS